MHPIRIVNHTSYRAYLLLITQLILLFNVTECTLGSRRTQVTDAQGRVRLQVPAKHLSSNSCPNPKDLSLLDSHGKQLIVERVEKLANGECKAIVK